MMLDYNYQMVKDFEAGWARFQRQEARREKIRAFIKAVGRWLAFAVWAIVPVAVAFALGCMLWASILMQPWELGL